MRETVEFRIREENAIRYLPPNTGVDIGYGVRKVVVDTSDALFSEIGRLHRQFRSRGEYFFSGREYHRSYTNHELEQASLFHLWAEKVFEPAGEECGTQYDESRACPKCGAGASQVSDLILDLRKAPKRVDTAVTIAGEQIVSQRFAECVTNAGLQGISLLPVRHKAHHDGDTIDLSVVPTGRKILKMAEVEGARHPTWSFWVWLNRAENKGMLDQAVNEYMAMKGQDRKRRPPIPVWYQLVVTSPNIEICAPTRVGSDPFDEDSYGRCERGDLLGLNLLSEVTVKRSNLPEADIMESKQMVGVRRGLLRPRRLLLVTARAWRAFEAAKLRGLAVEVAHLT